MLWLLVLGIALGAATCYTAWLFVEPMVIGIEGNISSGKSTFCNRLNGKTYGFGKIRCVLETIPPTLLRLFYRACEEGQAWRYALTIQISTLMRRFTDIQYARMAYKWTASIVLLDRSMLGNMAFAFMHVLNGNISLEEAQVLVEESKDLKQAISKLSVLVYLHCSAERCKASAEKRGLVDKDIPLSYLQGIALLHVYGAWHLMLAYPQLKVRVLNWERFGTDEFKGGHQEALKHVVQSRAPRLYRVASDAIGAGAADGEQKKNLVVVNMDNHRRPLPDGVYPRLKPQYRFVHTQRCIDDVMDALAAGRDVALVSTKPCLLDLLNAPSITAEHIADKAN